MALGNREVELTAYCGLYCGDCLRYDSSVPVLASALLGELTKVEFNNYANVKRAQVKEFENYDTFLQIINAIIGLKCTPCRSGGDGCLKSCEIKECVLEKGFEGCWECEEIEQCARFEHFKPFHGDAQRQNCRKVKEYGIDNWAACRTKFYSWL